MSSRLRWWISVLLVAALSACGPSVPLPEAQTRIKEIVDATAAAAAPEVPVEARTFTGGPSALHPCGFGIMVGMGEGSTYRLVISMGEPDDLGAVLDAVAQFWAAQGFEVQREGSQDVTATDGDFSYSAALINPDVGGGWITGTTPCYY